MTKCFLCEKFDLIPILDLGLSPIANNLESDELKSKNSEKIPLILGKCQDGCGHIQVMQHVDQHTIFDNYLYTSSVSTTLTQHLSEIALHLDKKFGLNDKKFVVDIGSNDGTFLNSVKRYTSNFLGIDPAKNLADIANSKGLNTLNSFFTSAVAEQVAIENSRADFIVSTNTFAHTPKIRDFVKGLRTLLSSEGVIVIEVHYLGAMLNANAFDTIYHEHFSYWSLSNLVKIFSDFDLEVFDVELLSIHHGQIRAFISHTGIFEPRKSVQDLLNKEMNQDIHGELLTNFSVQVRQIKNNLRDLFTKIRSQGKVISGYGAPAKASTMLSFLDFSTSDINIIYDKSVLKQGKYLPGTSIIIAPPDRISIDRPDYLFLFSWNFLDEISNELKEKFQFSGNLIVPIPELTITNINEL